MDIWVTEICTNLVQAAGGDPDFEAKTPDLYDLLSSNIVKYDGSIRRSMA